MDNDTNLDVAVYLYILGFVVNIDSVMVTLKPFMNKFLIEIYIDWILDALRPVANMSFMFGTRTN